MKMLVAAVAFATLVASPAFAQSYDPDIGSGNTAPQADAANYLSQPLYQGHVGAFAQVPVRSAPAAVQSAPVYHWPRYNAEGVDPNATGD